MNKERIKMLLPGVFVRGRRHGQKIALTFDDGPHPENTPVILEHLAAAGAKGTFFLVGRQAEKYPRLVKRIFEEGHEVAGHCYSHVPGENPLSEFKGAMAAIENISGKRVRLYRPPWGRLSIVLLALCRLRGKIVVLWSFDSGDYRCARAEEMVAHIKNGTIRGGEVILFHDDYHHTVTALPDILGFLKGKGFMTCTISELMKG